MGGVLPVRFRAALRGDRPFDLRPGDRLARGSRMASSERGATSIRFRTRSAWTDSRPATVGYPDGAFVSGIVGAETRAPRISLSVYMAWRCSIGDRVSADRARFCKQGGTVGPGWRSVPRFLLGAHPTLGINEELRAGQGFRCDARKGSVHVPGLRIGIRTGAPAWSRSPTAREQHRLDRYSFVVGG